MKHVYTFADLRNWSAVTAGVEPPIRLGVFGHPIVHSISPQMQNAALRHSGRRMQYARFDVAPDELEAALRLLPELHFIGANLTVPHKIAGAHIADELDEFSRCVGAINVLRVEGSKLFGINTDGLGFSRAIRSEFVVNLRDLHILLVGAGGGAGRAIAMQCAVERCQRLVLLNRTAGKAEKLVEELASLFTDARVSGAAPHLLALPWSEDSIRQQIGSVDLVVNATSLGMHPTDPPVLPPELLARHLLVYDTVYTSARTPLLIAAEQAGARGANGLSMLLHQGALAFEAWFDSDAPVDVMRAALSAAAS